MDQELSAYSKPDTSHVRGRQLANAAACAPVSSGWASWALYGHSLESIM